ncbi:MAG: RpiB/LacA/LacB family sugar-phosphate isomerase [Porphyromonas sp.]|nr:RpiB/LacA/LacB family sugar-phosphate isomerase [Porphyromonas sp.]
MDIKKIGLASDHAGFSTKEAMKSYLQKILPEVELVDYGTYSEASVDYPDFAHKLGKAIEEKEVDYGLASCGSANGISMTLNKYPHVRAAICWTPELAELARLHNDANILSLPGRFVSEELAQEMTKVFFTTDFEGGRHQRRVDKIAIHNKED